MNFRDLAVGDFFRTDIQGRMTLCIKTEFIRGSNRWGSSILLEDTRTIKKGMVIDLNGVDIVEKVE